MHLTRRWSRAAAPMDQLALSSSSAPNVTLFSKDYQAPKSVRSNLQWSGPILGNRFTATIDGTYRST